MKASALLFGAALLVLATCGADPQPTRTSSPSGGFQPSEMIATVSPSAVAAGTSTLTPVAATPVPSPGATPMPAATTTNTPRPTSTPRPQPTATPIVIPDYGDNIAALQAQINTLGQENRRMEDCLAMFIDIFLAHEHPHGGDLGQSDPPHTPPSQSFRQFGVRITEADFAACNEFLN